MLTCSIIPSVRIYVEQMEFRPHVAILPSKRLLETLETGIQHFVPARILEYHASPMHATQVMSAHTIVIAALDFGAR